MVWSIPPRNDFSTRYSRGSSEATACRSRRTRPPRDRGRQRQEQDSGHRDRPRDLPSDHAGPHHSAPDPLSLGLFGHATVEIVLAPSTRYTRRCVRVLINLVTLTINLVLSFLFVGSLAQGGLALAISISVCIEALSLLVLLSGRLPSFAWGELLATIAKCCLASGLMAVALYLFVHASDSRLNLERIAPLEYSSWGRAWLWDSRLPWSHGYPARAGAESGPPSG